MLMVFIALKLIGLLLILIAIGLRNQSEKFQNFYNRTYSIIRAIGFWTWQNVEKRVIESFFAGLGDVFKNASGALRMLQNGNIQTYGTHILVGTVIILFFLLPG